MSKLVPVNGFPTTIYHPVYESLVVSSQEEMDEYAPHGWSTSPIVVSNADMLRAKIEYLNKELATAYKKLAKLQESCGVVNPAPPPEETIEEPEDEKQAIEGEETIVASSLSEVLELPKKRGRPLKADKILADILKE